VSIKNKLVTAVTTAGLLAGLFGSAFVPAVRAAVTTDNLTASGADYIVGGSIVGTIDDVTIVSGAYVTYTIGTELGAVTYSLSGAGNCTFGTGLNAGTLNLVTGVTVSSTSITAPAGAAVTGTTFLVTGSTVGACVLSATEGADTANTSYDITVIAAAQAGVPSVAKSKLYETYTGVAAQSSSSGAGALPTASAPDATVAASGGVAYLTFLPKDAYDAATASTTDVTVTASGPCLVASQGNTAVLDTVGTTAKTLNFTDLTRNAAGNTYASGTTDSLFIAVVTDGSGGGTCSVAFTAAKDAGTKILIATGSVVFYGTATTVTLAVDQAACLNSAVAACTGAISFTAKDANGNRSALTLAHGTDFTLTADDGSAGATLTANSATTSSAAGTVSPTCTTDQEKLTITVNKTGYTSNSVSFYCSKEVASSVTASWGSASVAAGSLQTLTISAFDDLGYPVAKTGGDIDFTLTVNATLYGTAPTSFDNDLDGVVTAKYIMPSAIGGTVQARILLAGSATTPDQLDIADAIEATEVVATTTVVGSTSSATMSVGPKKLKATATFGAVAANKKVTFVIENAAGRVRTYYRKANASGVATFTIKLRGTWDVYASYGDDITELGKLVRK
jgi:hypothetical protein